jgi:hypothetical protein
MGSLVLGFRALSAIKSLLAKLSSLQQWLGSQPNIKIFPALHPTSITLTKPHQLDLVSCLATSLPRRNSFRFRFVGHQPKMKPKTKNNYNSFSQPSRAIAASLVRSSNSHRKISRQWNMINETLVRRNYSTKCRCEERC